MDREIAKRPAGLSEQEQRALLADLLRKKTTRPKRAPLSFAQERLWFLYQLDPANVAHNTFNAVRLSGALDGNALERAFNQVVQRHEILRTTFTTLDGQAMQVIAPALSVQLPQVDLQHLSEVEQETRVQQLAWEEARRPFDLTLGPLVRTTLLRLSETRHVLLLAIHHIVSDNWSVGVLLHELMSLYKATEPSLPALPIHYADFAVWQRKWLQGNVLATQRAYWQEQLRNLPALHLPTDHPRQGMPSYAGATYSWRLGASLTGELKSLSQREGLSLFMVLLAGCLTLLQRYSGQTDITVRSPVANRTRRELESLIGYFVNTLALRTDLSGNPTFRELVHRVSEVCQGAYAHQDLPFEKAIEDVQLAPRAGGTLFPVMFILQNAPLPLPDVPGLQIEALELDDGLAPFELTIALREMEGGLRGRLTYSTDLFEAPSIQRLAEHLQTIWESAVADPERRLASLAEQIPVEQIPVMHGLPTKKADYVAPRTPSEEALAEIWARMLGVTQVGIHDNFFELGGDSLLVLQVISKARQAGLSLTPRQLFQYQTIADLVTVENTVAVKAEQGIVTGPVPPIPIVMLNYAHLSPQAWWRTFETLVEVPRILCPAHVKEATQCLVEQHDNLRLRLVRENADYRLFIAESDENVFLERDLSNLPAPEQDAVIEAAREEMWSSLNFSTGPLLRIVFFNLGPQRLARMLIIIHHFATDGYSTGILLDDFQTACQQRMAGKPIRLPAKTTSIKQWAEKMYAYVHSDLVKPELIYQKSLPWASRQPTPVDHPEITHSPFASLTGSLSAEETQVLLDKVPVAHNVELLDVLVTACALTYARRAQFKLFSICILSHGRNLTLDGMDLFRTVGNLYTTYPLFLDVEQTLDIGDPEKSLRQVAEQRARIPNGGATWLWTYYYCNEDFVSGQGEVKGSDNVFFNYLGSIKRDTQSALFRPMDKPIQEANTQMYDVRNRAPHTCKPVVEGGQLKVTWEYFSLLDEQATIHGMIQEYLSVLRALIKTA